MKTKFVSVFKVLTGIAPPPKKRITAALELKGFTRSPVMIYGVHACSSGHELVTAPGGGGEWALAGPRASQFKLQQAEVS